MIASGSQEPLARVHEGEAAPAQTLRKHIAPDNFDNAGVDQWRLDGGAQLRPIALSGRNPIGEQRIS
jgi:hypothetical protein